MPLRIAWLKLGILFLGYGLAGWLLSRNHAVWAVWLAVEGIVVYLAWSGTGAIALSVVGITGILWSGTLFIKVARGIPGVTIPLQGPQLWAAELLELWILAIVLTFSLAFIGKDLQLSGLSRVQSFWLLVLITNLGLKLGHAIASTLS